MLEIFRIAKHSFGTRRMVPVALAMTSHHLLAMACAANIDASVSLVAGAVSCGVVAYHLWRLPRLVAERQFRIFRRDTRDLQYKL
jgi:hypothetical protein